MYGPFRSSADLFAEFNRLQSVMDQVFGPPQRSSIRGASGFPVLNVGTTPDTIEVMALVPGLEANAIDLTIDKGLLTISGERRSGLPAGGERTSVHASERYSGPFRRVISLPDDADPAQVQAAYRDGILRVTIGKRESSRPRRIEVN